MHLKANKIEDQQTKYEVKADIEQRPSFNVQPRKVLAHRRSAALPAHELRSCMSSRAQIAIQSVSVIPSIAALRLVVEAE